MPFKFAFLGCWHSHAKMHLREAETRPNEVELIGAYDSDPVVVKRWSQEFGVDMFPSAEAVLDSQAEAVVIEGRVFQNLDYAEKALRAGKHVLLEKPAGVDLEQLRRVQKLSIDKGLCLQMAYMWRYNPAINEIVRLVQNGTLGDIFYYRGHIPKPKSWHQTMESENGCYKGSVYFEMAGHLVDLMVAMMGKPQRVQSTLGQHYGNNRQHTDNAVVVHEFENGLATIDTASMHIDSSFPRRIEVYGTKGTAIHTPIGSSKLHLVLERADQGYKKGSQDLEITTANETPTLLRELVACVSGEKTADYTLAHDLTVQETLFAGCGITDGKALKPDHLPNM
ncbi:Gfo/Idh/MocA family oxidoreductase [Candidatus Poribacteria bacterium]|nr:Gfo/Idh/MocA family oxidoreductase [Candidatus Poribacteria bacterium]|tara:strand:+ start:3765 stop:4778 length:1014 start_codon:yes stop_codon:yes gene_type:complete